MKTWSIQPSGVWLDIRSPTVCSARPGLFLDRDGVIVHDKNFLTGPNDVELLPGAAELIAEANRCAAPVAVVTNQSGIARRLFSWMEFTDVEQEIARRLERAGAQIDAVLACPFHPKFTECYGERESYWRKPGPGLILEAARLLKIDIGMSWLVGDQTRDIEAAKNAGLAGAIFLNNGSTSSRPALVRSEPSAKFKVEIATNVFNVIEILQDVGLLISHGSQDVLAPS